MKLKIDKQLPTGLALYYPRFWIEHENDVKNLPKCAICDKPYEREAVEKSFRFKPSSECQAKCVVNSNLLGTYTHSTIWESMHYDTDKPGSREEKLFNLLYTGNEESEAANGYVYESKANLFKHEDFKKTAVLLKKSWFESMRKFHKAVVQALELIFDDEKYEALVEDNEDASHYIFCDYPTNKSVFNPSTIKCCEGFIAEGKTSFNKRVNKFKQIDGEFDELFRLPLKDGSRLPDKYIAVFSLFGIISAIFHQIEITEEAAQQVPLYLNRSFGSLSIFGRLSGESQQKRWRRFYENLSFWFSDSKQIELTFFQWSALSSPLPWKESRNIEKALYPTEEKYKLYSSLVYALLKTIYGHLGLYVSYDSTGFKQLCEDNNLVKKLEYIGDSMLFFRSEKATESCSKILKWVNTAQHSFHNHWHHFLYVDNLQLLLELIQAKWLAPGLDEKDFSSKYLLEDEEPWNETGVSKKFKCEPLKNNVIEIKRLPGKKE